MPEAITALQAAIDRARALGQPITPPVIRPNVGSTDSVRAELAEAQGGGSFENLLNQAAAKEGIDAALLKAVAQAESNLDPFAVSGAGAKGVMQLMDGTARELGVANPYDPAQNIAAGAKYLKQMLTRYGGDVTRALAAYNAGPGNVDEHDGVPPFAETQSYVQKVLGSLRDNRKR
ncbi:MAG TPA: lytic transglycosylase domain-containing protein [Chloroflexota bacterium]|nr:lytic transglycosylase domain-containing protein [Chloroflexota bacterium]